MSPIDPTASAKNVAETAKISLEVVNALVEKAASLKRLFSGVVSMPAEAEKAVEEILEEVEKSLVAVDKATRDFFVAVNDPAAFLDDADKVHEMSSSYLPKLVEEGRGHCDRILDIQWDYLQGWLDQFFPKNIRQREEAQRVLQELSDADENLFRRLVEAAERMRDTARDAYRLELSGNREDAEALLRDAGLKLLDMRDAFNDALVEMTTYKREFLKARHADTPRFDPSAFGNDT